MATRANFAQALPDIRILFAAALCRALQSSLADNAVEKLKRAGATGRTILAALPTDPDGGIERVLTPDQVIERRFPPPHKQMPTYFKPPGSTIIEALPAEVVGERFPKEGEAGVLIRSDELGKWLDAIPRIEERARTEQIQRDWARRLLFDPRPLGGEPKKFAPRRAPGT